MAEIFPALASDPPLLPFAPPFLGSLLDRRLFVVLALIRIPLAPSLWILRVVARCPALTSHDSYICAAQSCLM